MFPEKVGPVRWIAFAGAFGSHPARDHPGGAVFSVSAWASASYSTQELAIFSLVNEYRVANGLGALLLSDTISDACTKDNLDMGKHGFLPNPIPDGVTGHITQASDYFPVGSAP